MAVLVIGCGNILRGDDAAGPVLVRRLWERGLPEGVRCADGGTGGMDVAFQMRGVDEVILVDACSSGSEPGELFEVPGDEVETPPLAGINLHAFRWDHAIVFARWLLKDDYPAQVTAFLVEGERFAIGAGLSPAVDRAIDRLADLLLERFAGRPPGGADGAAGPPRHDTIPRPQPVGIFPFPRSHLLVAAGDAKARAALMLGDASVADGTVAADPASAVGRYDAFVLAPSRERLRDLEACGDARIVSLARAAAFAHGLTDELPDPGPLDGELEALVLMTAAAGWLERGDPARAVQTLDTAVAAAREPAPVFAALLQTQVADLLLADHPGDSEAAVSRLRDAAALAAAARIPLLGAEIQFKQGLALQRCAGDGDRATLLAAVQCYQRALAAGITPEADPAAYVQVQNNLGLAYLSMPAREAGDLLRTGIAVQCFRKALAVHDRDGDPGLWASLTMNLANALQYLPTSHPEDNLARAVDLYEEVLAVRTEGRDPVAHARVLMNQGNALSHLGIFGPATEKLAAAGRLLSRHGCHEEAVAARELLARAQARRAEPRSDGVAAAGPS